MKQQTFWKKPNPSHGGLLRAGKRKIARPLTTKSPMQISLKSSRARGSWSLQRRGREVEKSVRALALQYRIRVYHFENVGNHLHLMVKASTRREFQSFLRVVPQAVMFLITGARKGNPKGKFWDAPAFTRIVQWGRDWLGMNRYMRKNRRESAGIPRADIDRIYAEADRAWKDP